MGDNGLSRSLDLTMRQLPLDLGPVVHAGLDDFIEGSNAEALAWLRQWPAPCHNQSPVYLWGASGAGKTHLMRALVEKALALNFGVTGSRVFFGARMKS